MSVTYLYNEVKFDCKAYLTGDDEHHEKTLQTVGMLCPLMDLGKYCIHRKQNIPPGAHKIHLYVLFLLLLAEVALIIEVTEEDDESDAVTKHSYVHGVGEVALCEQIVARVRKKHHELDLRRQKRKVSHCCMLLDKQ